MILQKNKFGFTLVEIIIVISILAIISVIAFISFQSYIKDARDGNRLTTLTALEKWINIYQIKAGTFPKPEWEIYAGKIGSGTYSINGEIGKNIATMIQINHLPKDPYYNIPYKYATNGDYTQF